MSSKITPEIVNVIENLSALGYTQRFIAKTIGVSSQTLTDWKQKNQDVANALCIGTDGLLTDIKSTLADIAMNGAKDSDRTSASTFLLNRYETIEPVATGASTGVSDEDIIAKIRDDIDG